MFIGIKFVIYGTLFSPIKSDEGQSLQKKGISFLNDIQILDYIRDTSVTKKI